MIALMMDMSMMLIGDDADYGVDDDDPQVLIHMR